MGSQTSEQVMALLKELAILKQQDTSGDSNPSQAQPDACRLRQQRHDEITAELKKLAEEKTSSRQAESS
jgi:hypothetical protein